MVTRVKITGLEDALASQKLKVSRAIAKSNFKDDLRDELVKEIRKNGIEPKLEESTIKNRKWLAKNNPTHPDFSLRKSNLTVTGKFLDSMLSKFIASKLRIIFDFPSTKHPKYLINPNKKGKPRKSSAKSSSMKDIARGQKDLGREISQVFERPSFLERISTMLVKAVKQNISK